MTKTRELVLAHLQTYDAEIIGYALEILNKVGRPIEELPTLEIVEILLQIETEHGSPKF